MFGFAVATHILGAPALFAAAQQLQWLLPDRGRAAETEDRDALVITANSSYQLTVAATLSPRGFHPTLAGSAPAALSQIRAHGHTLKLAVIDTALPGHASVARALKDVLPAGSIIVLSRHTPQDVVPLLLRWLRAFDSGADQDHSARLLPRDVLARMHRQDGYLTQDAQ